jgi:hypothetical protein
MCKSEIPARLPARGEAGAAGTCLRAPHKQAAGRRNPKRLNGVPYFLSRAYSILLEFHSRL